MPDQPIIESLDPEIAAIVLLLRSRRMPTLSSCQGGKGHAFPNAVIVFDFPRRERGRAVDQLFAVLREIRLNVAEIDSQYLAHHGILRIVIDRAELARWNREYGDEQQRTDDVASYSEACGFDCRTVQQPRQGRALECGAGGVTLRSPQPQLELAV